MKISVHGQKGSFAVFADDRRVTTNRFAAACVAKRWGAEYKAAVKAGHTDPVDTANYNTQAGA